MIHTEKDPIVAIATAAGRGGIGIVRLSFDKALDDKIIVTLFGERKLTPRHAHLLPFFCTQENLLDEVIVLYFPAPSSYTGETVIEIQAHGGPVLMKMILDTCLKKCSIFGIRVAEAGEFTKRAFFNGRIDLAQAEAVADLIDAVSRSAAQAASRSLSGDFSRVISNIGKEVDEARAYVEATLDFPEEDIDPLTDEQIFVRLEQVQKELTGIIDNAQQGRVLREGITVALVGSPNVGKSSLMNTLAGEEIAIVTDIAGTTRDRIEHWITVDGIPLRLVDTAGLRETKDIVEQKGIERTLSEIKKADIVLHLIDASGEVADNQKVLSVVMENVRPGVPLVTVANKVDIANREVADSIRLSAKTGEGVEVLRQKIIELAGMSNTAEGIFIARERHINCLSEAKKHIQTALAMRGLIGMPELLAEELRLAGQSLGEILGITTADDILGMIFSKFCIGK